MAIKKLTFDDSLNTAKDDAFFNWYLTNKTNGIFADLGDRCDVTSSNGKITFKDGFVSIFGRRVYVENGTSISVNLDGTRKVYVVLRVDTVNNEATLATKEGTSSNYPTLSQTNLLESDGIYELPLVGYSKTTSLTLDKERLARRIVGMLPNMRVMFIYIGGSVAYGTFSPGKSDLDINLFVDGYSGALKVNIPDGDLFVYGREKLVDRFAPECQMSLYKKCFTDDFLSLPETLVYLDPDYRKEYEAYMHTDFAKCMKGYLENFLGYYGFLYNGSSRLGKRFYHVIRVRGQLEEWKRTGVYSLSLPEEYYRREMEFKEGHSALSSRKEWLDLIGRYLDEIGEIKEGMKDG